MSACHVAKRGDKSREEHIEVHVVKCKQCQRLFIGIFPAMLEMQNLADRD